MKTNGRSKNLDPHRVNVQSMNSDVLCTRHWIGARWRINAINSRLRDSSRLEAGRVTHPFPLGPVIDCSGEGFVVDVEFSKAFRLFRGGFVLWSALELIVFVGSDRSGGPGRCGASTLALSQLTDLNILEFHTPFKSPCNSLNPQGTIVF